MKQMTTAYIARAVEHVKDVACDIRIAMRDCNVRSGALCEDTSATAPGSKIEYPPFVRYKVSLFPFLPLVFVSRCSAALHNRVVLCYHSGVYVKNND